MLLVMGSVFKAWSKGKKEGWYWGCFSSISSGPKSQRLGGVTMEKGTFEYIGLGGVQREK